MLFTLPYRHLINTVILALFASSIFAQPQVPPTPRHENSITLNRLSFHRASQSGTANTGIVSPSSSATSSANVLPARAYQPKFDYNYGFLDNPKSLYFNDLDGDGKPEIVTASNSQSVYTFRNNTTQGNINTTSFPAPVRFVVGASNAAVTGDMDGDGKTDIIAVSPANDSIIILRNTSTGSLSPATFADRISLIIAGTGFTGAHLVSVSDLDGDGRLDIIVSHISGNREYLEFIRNNSTGTLTKTSFSLHLRLDYPLLIASIAVGDLDGDGKPDVVSANQSTGLITILRNASSAGNIAFALGRDIQLANLGDLTLADIDGDGKKDMLVNVRRAPGDATLHILRNTATPGVLTPASFGTDVTFASGSGSFDVGDLDGDGKPDIAVGDTGKLSYWLNTATPGTITPASLAAKIDILTPSRNINSVKIGDLDGDGIADIAASYTLPVVNSPGGLMVLQLTSSGSIPVITGIDPATGPVGSTVTIAGVNFNSTPAGNTVYFGAVKAVVTDASATSIKVTVPAGASYGTISVLTIPTGLTAYSPGAFTPTFYNPYGTGIPDVFYQPKIDFPTGSLPYATAFGDLDGDGKPEMVVCNTRGNTISVYRNLSSGGSLTAASFGSRIDFATGNSPVAIAIKDLDGDGKPDLVTVNELSNSISVFHNLATGAFSASSLAPAIAFATGGEHPFSIVISDLNLNGKPDIIVTNLYSNSIAVFDNTTGAGILNSGSFSIPQVISGNSNAPRSIAAADLNGDGLPEIIVVNQQAATISIFRNVSPGPELPGALAYWNSLPTGNAPIGVVTGDIDRDGKADIAVANNSSNTVSIYRQIPTTNNPNSLPFAQKVDFATGSGPFAIAIGDLDGDGYPDLATPGSLSNTVSVLRNTANTGSVDAGTFAPFVSFAAGSYPLSVAINDLDGDGIPELATTSDANTFSIFRFNNNVASQRPVISSFSPAKGPAGSDVTLSGVRFNTAPESNTVFFGAVKATVTGGSATSLTVKVPAGATYQPVTVVNTGNKLLGSSSLPFVTTFPNPAGGTGIHDNFIAARKDIAISSAPYTIAYADFDGDGRADIAAVNAFSNKITILQNLTPGGTLSGPAFSTAIEIATGLDPRSIAVGDVNGDGKPDIVVTNTSSSTVSVIINKSSSAILSNSSFMTPRAYPAGASAFAVAIGDLDGDGKPEIVTASYSPSGVTVLANHVANGTLDNSSFAAATQFSAGSGPRFVAISDLDGDGKQDLAVANYQSGTVSVLRNTSTVGVINSASFAPPTDFATGATPQGVVIADVDGDNKGDICVVNFGSNTVSVLRNTASSGSLNASSFAAKVDFATGLNPFSIAAGDADGDGKVDLLTCNANSSTITILRNATSSGPLAASSFTRTDFNTGGYPVFIAMGDLDGDAVPEITTANAGSNSISILNTHAAPAGNTVMANATGKSQQGAQAGEHGALNMQLYPNPTQGEFNVTVASGRAVYSIEVIDEHGKIISKRTLNTGGTAAQFTQRLSLRNQPAGVYYVKIITTSGIRIEKLVLQR